MAPEILDSGEPSDAGDVSAFGMMCLVSAPIFDLLVKQAVDVTSYLQELFSRMDPFPKLRTFQAIQHAILEGQFDRPSSEETRSRLTDCWWNLCSSCWKFDQISRPSISDVVNRISYILDPKLEIYGMVHHAYPPDRYI